MTNLLDRVIGYFNPQAGLQRVKARGAMSLLGGYIGARYRKSTRDWFAPTLSADMDTIYDLPTLRGRSRDLVRNTPLATGAVGTVVTNVIGGGLQLVSRPDWDTLSMTEKQADKWRQNTEREFALFAESTTCDITRKLDFYGLQALAFRSCLESGDSFALLPMVPVTGSPYQTRIQLLEADRIGTPIQAIQVTEQLTAGIEKDQYGAPIAYWILRHHPGGPMGLTLQADRYMAFGAKTGRRNVLHLFQQDRPEQTRGVPYLAPVIELLMQVAKYSEAELAAAVITALLAVFVTSEDGQGIANPSGNDGKNIDPDKEIKLGTASVIDLNPGDKIETVAPNRPNGAFDPFFQACVRQIGVALQLPFEVLIKHFTASYSAARAAMLEAWRFYRMRRIFMANNFCQPIFETWMEEAIALGRIDAPGFFDDPAIRRAYLMADWIGDSPGQIDPLKEAQAAQLRVQEEFSTRAVETMQLTGMRWEDVHREAVREKKLRIKDGIEVANVPVPPKEPVGEKQAAQDSGDAPPGNGSDTEKGDKEN